MDTSKTNGIITTEIEVIETDINTKLSKEKTDLSKDAVVDGKMSAENSEYDSADSYSDEDEDTKIRSRASDQEEHSSDTGSSVILEREEGDGQESVPSKKVDDDEDKKNPQYIPKRGTFYEHDDRTADDVEGTEVIEAEKEKEGKKKVWQDKKEKWSHDRFNDTEQAPKSKNELISIYGYDIRNEDGPPRARRRRRYGRGPNKYTRNWEDEDAYNKPPAPPRVSKKQRPTKNTEEFPPLGRSNTQTPEEQLEQTEQATERQENHNQKTFEKPDAIAKEPVSHSPTPPPETTTAHPDAAQPEPVLKPGQQRGAGAGRKPKREIKDSDYRGFTAKTRQQRATKTGQQKVLPPRAKEDYVQTQNFANKANSVQELDREMSKLSVDGVYKGGKYSNQRQGSVPPRLQSEQKGSKRYSSMRQRSLPEANTPPVPNFQHTSFYPNDYSQPPPSTQPPLLHAAPPIHPATTQVALAPIPQPATAAPLLPGPFPPQGFAQPPFLQPAAAQFMPPPPQPVYVPGLAQGFQGYQQQFNPVTQPTELYQPQGGITYYSTDQQVAQRPVPQKRPKAAIPIVAPPSYEKKEEDFAPNQQADALADCNENQKAVDVQQ